MKKNKVLTYIVSIAIALGVGGLSALITNKAMEEFETVAKPAISPPGWLFPVVWTVLFILMGISAGMVYLSNDPKRTKALIIYGVQLIVNFFWSIIFFNLGAYMFAFWWLIILLALIAVMIKFFYDVKPAAGYLQLPYLLWVCFAGYLNCAIWLMNR